MRDSEGEREREHGITDCGEVQCIADTSGRDPPCYTEIFSLACSGE